MENTKLIRLEDGTLIEVEFREDSFTQVSGGFSEYVNSNLSVIKPLLLRICQPIYHAWQELNRDLEIDEISIELGLSFESEGNLYITKSKAGANLSLAIKLKPSE